MLRGFATINLFAADHEAAKAWYTEFLGVEPYFQRPGYVEFRIGDYQHELGIVDSKYAPHLKFNVGPAGAIAYWHVDDVQAALDRLVSLGAKELEGIKERGEGFVTASVLDPFGNILGIMYNKHYLEVVSRRGSA
jgi:predicted enzyme related to lactoylglutathione lyase